MPKIKIEVDLTDIQIKQSQDMFDDMCEHKNDVVATSCLDCGTYFHGGSIFIRFIRALHTGGHLNDYKPELDKVLWKKLDSLSIIERLRNDMVVKEYNKFNEGKITGQNLQSYTLEHPSYLKMFSDALVQHGVLIEFEPTHVVPRILFFKNVLGDRTEFKMRELLDNEKQAMIEEATKILRREGVEW